MKKIFHGLCLGLIILTSIFLINPLFSRAQGTITTTPAPYIKSPTGGTLSGTVSVTIGIAPSNVLAMEMRAIDPANVDRWLGYATRLSQGSANEILFVYDWKTNDSGYPNGKYYLYAVAQIGVGSGTTGGVITSPMLSKIPVTLNNSTVSIPTSQPTSQPSSKLTPTTNPSVTTQPTASQSPQTWPTPNPQATPTIHISSQATPVVIPSNLPVKDLLANSQVFASIDFNLFREKPVYLEKIEGRISTDKEKFLIIIGKSTPNYPVILTLNSQPLVLSAQADSSGNWTYTLEKPLEPGKHEAYVEVNINDTVEKTGPYPFNIAQAQATADNPTGASLDLVDPQKKAMNNYLYAVGGLLGVAILILIIILYIKHVKKMRVSAMPQKEF